jgi:3-methyladenine DNA glycosylase Tag
MKNHDMIAQAMHCHAGEVLATSDIRNIVLRSFPIFNPGSLLPNDHGSGNKCSCWCVGTKSQIFEPIGRGQYRVLPGVVRVRTLDPRRERREPSFPTDYPSTSTRTLSAVPKLGGMRLWVEITRCLERGLDNWRGRIQDLRQVPAVEARGNGRSWNDAEVFEGIVLAILSNSTDWSKVEAVRPFLKSLFLDFDLTRYAVLHETDIDNKFVPWFVEHRSGSMQLGNSLKQLIAAAEKLRYYSSQHGSVENFLGWLFRRNGSDPKRLANDLGAPGIYKLPGLGIPLAAEALKNIGYDVAKPDRHVNRAAACLGLVEFPRWDRRSGYETPAAKPPELLTVMQAVEGFAREVGETVTFVDNAVWLLCAKSGLHLSNEELATLAAGKA